jgi:hypothetical protein
VGLLTLDFGLELGHFGGLFIELAAKVILRAFALELISLEAVGDADRLEAGDNEFAGIDIAGLCNSRGHPFIKQLGLETFGFFGLLNPLGQLLFHDVSLLQDRSKLVLDRLHHGVAFSFQEVNLTLEDALVVQRFAELRLQLRQMGRSHGRHGRHVLNQRRILLHGHLVFQIGVELFHLPLRDGPLLAQLRDFHMRHGPLLLPLALDQSKLVLQGLDSGIPPSTFRGQIGIRCRGLFDRFTRQSWWRW